MATIDQGLGSIQYFFKGVKMLNMPGLRRFVVIPFIINIILFALLFYLGIHYFSVFTDWIDSFLPTWLQWLNWLLWVLFVISAVIIVSYTFTIIANLIGAPFNGFLSEKVEIMVTGVEQVTEGGWSIIYKDIPRSIKRQLHFMAYYIPLAVIGLVLFFIPIIQIIAGPLWFLFNGWMMTIQYMDYPMDNHRISFRDMRNLLSQKRVANLSFGSIVMFVTMIPIVNFIVMPAAVIGATLMWIDLYGVKPRQAEVQ